MLVAVGSKNPAKISAVRSAFLKFFKKVEVVSLDVESGVSKQPFGDEEAIVGAINRAKEAMKKSNADFGVGLEGAYRKVGKFGYFESPWFAVVDKNGKIGLAGGGGFCLPLRVVKELKKGEEMGDVMDKITGVSNSKQKMGAVGYLTNGVIDRKKYYEDYVIMAMARFLHKELY